MIQLKNFQQDVVDRLLAFTAPEYKVDNLTIKAPTGAGKTIMLLSWIDEYIRSTGDNVSLFGLRQVQENLKNNRKTKQTAFQVSRHNLSMTRYLMALNKVQRLLSIMNV